MVVIIIGLVVVCACLEPSNIYGVIAGMITLGIGLQAVEVRLETTAERWLRMEHVGQMLASVNNTDLPFE